MGPCVQSSTTAGSTPDNLLHKLTKLSPEYLVSSNFEHTCPAVPAEMPWGATHQRALLHHEVSPPASRLDHNPLLGSRLAIIPPRQHVDSPPQLFSANEFSAYS